MGSKMLLMSFFVINVKGRYNMLLGRDWIHANECVPLKLHPQMVQWVRDWVEVIEVDDSPCVAIAKSQVDM
jgi:hypothetical protein